MKAWAGEPEPHVIGPLEPEPEALQRKVWKYLAAPVSDFKTAAPAPDFSLKRLRLQGAKKVMRVPSPDENPCSRILNRVVTGGFNFMLISKYAETPSII